MLADGEECGLDALRPECAQHRRRVPRPGTVVKRENDFAIAQEVMLLEMLEAEARPACRVDLHHARNAERGRVAAPGLRGRLRGGRNRSGRERGRTWRQRRAFLRL